MIGPEYLTHEARRRNLEAREHKVATAVRGYVALDDAEWLGIENTVLRLVLDAATLDPQRLPAADGRSDLAVSLLGRALVNSARDARYSTSYLRALAALAFASAANFPTAGVIARAAMRAVGDVGPFERWALTVLADRELSLDREGVPALMREYARAEDEAVRSGSASTFARADRLFDSCAGPCARSFAEADALLLLFWAQVRRRLHDLSAARILLASGYIDERYVQALLRTSSPLLYPTQALAIEEHGLLDPRRNALAILPTSTGKSLLGELAIVAALTDERPLGVYLAPYRALADQIFRRMRGRLAHIGVACEARRGGYLSERPVTADVRTVLVATPEAFDAFLRLHPELLARIACCVFDEFHLVEQPVRGLRYEGLVGRLRDEDLGVPTTKIVALSPVVSPLPDLVDWLRVEDGGVIESAWRPTARRLAIAGPDGLARYFTPGDYLQPRDPGVPSWIGIVPFPKALQYPPQSVRRHLLSAHDAAVAENVASIAMDQLRRLASPVLIVSSTREQTRFLAAVVARNLPPVEEGHPARTLAAAVTRRCPYLFTLQGCLVHGVAYHNASLPSWVRERLEDLMESRSLHVVAATTTLAEGVDLPFRVVVMADWRQWLFGQQRPMPTLLFRNIAGRCGRAGAFHEGDTIIVDNPGRTPGSEAYRHRYETYVQLYVRPRAHALESAVTQAIVSGQPTALAEMHAALESQFTAFVDARRPEEGREEAAFTASLYAGRSNTVAPHVQDVARRFVAQTLDEPEFPVLKRTSPLALTDFGRSVMTTGLSPRSGTALARFLRSCAPPAEPRKGRKVRNRHNIEWLSMLAALSTETGRRGPFVVEFQGGSFERIGKKGYPINKANFETVLLAWMSGLPVEEIAYLTIRKKDLQRASASWLTNSTGSPPHGLEEQIEQVAVFVNGYVAQQWSWVLRGAAVIADHAGGAERLDLVRLADRIEHGVRHTLSSKLLGRGCPVDRSKVDRIVGAYVGVAGDGVEPDGLLAWIAGNRAALIGLQVGFFAGSRIDEADLDALIAFLEQRREA